MNSEENPFAKVVAQAWSDEDYKRRLLDDPAGALAEAGAEVPDGVQLCAVEDTDTVKHLVIPAPPGEGEIDEDDLERVSGGTIGCCCCGCGVGVFPPRPAHDPPGGCGPGREPLCEGGRAGLVG